MRAPKWKTPAALGSELDQVLASDSDDAVLLALELMRREPAFSLLSHRWGPELYRRNRIKFRPFILSNLSFWGWDGRRWSEVAWKKHADQLEPWLEDVDARDDVPLFRALLQKKLRGEGKDGEKIWRAAVLERLAGALTHAERGTVVEKMSLGFRLDESTAIRAYELAPEQVRGFIVEHLPWSFGLFGGEKRQKWTKLWDQAKAAGDDELFFGLYARQVSVAQWKDDIEALAGRVEDPTELVSALEKHHPRSHGMGLGDGFVAILERRGEDVFPYVFKHLREVYAYGWGERKAYARLRDLTVDKGWTSLWGALVRTCARQDEFDKDVEGILLDAKLSDQATIRKLSLLSGTSREFNFGPFGLAQVRQISDDNAVRLYEAYPVLLRGPFKVNVSPSWHSTYPKLMRRAIEAQDEMLVDYLASRIVTRQFGVEAKIQKQIDELVEYYSELLGDDVEFARRAARVLGIVPAYSIWNYRELIRANKLARLFYERSAARYLCDSTVMRDLLEATEIHAQALAFRALSLDDPRARAAARENLDLLEATLLRPLHRKTRALAFSALENAVADSAQARRVVRRAKDAMDLPDKRYPKASLIGLIGRLLHRFPEARGEGEVPRVFRKERLAS